MLALPWEVQLATPRGLPTATRLARRWGLLSVKQKAEHLAQPLEMLSVTLKVTPWASLWVLLTDWPMVLHSVKQLGMQPGLRWVRCWAPLMEHPWVTPLAVPTGSQSAPR